MQTKKFREVALLTLPVLAIAAIVAGARSFADWREANKVPRIESFVLRAPTEWEAYNGAEIGYTARMVEAPVDNSDNWMDLRLEFINQEGKRWSKKRSNWQQVVAIQDDNVHTAGRPHLWTVQGGLRWKKLVGQGSTVRVNIVFEEQSYQQTHSSAAREFVVGDEQNSWQAPRRARRANFQVAQVQLKTEAVGFEGELHHQVLVYIKGLEPAPKTPLNRRFSSSDQTDSWELRFDSGKSNEQIQLRELTDFPQSKEGIEITGVEFFEKRSALREQPAHLSRFLSIDDGWPQLIRIELPQGLPAKPGTIDLPFTATLAPLPK